MNLSRFGRHFVLIRAAGVVVVLATVLALLLISRPETENLDKYHSLFSRGEYEICTGELTILLRRKPHWHEARELQIQAQLACGQPLAALNNLMFLMRAGHPSQYEEAVLEKLTTEPDTLRQGRVLLEESLADNPNLDQARRFVLALETAFANPAPDPANALAHLIILAKRDQSDRYLEKMTARICSNTDQHLSMLDQALAEDPEFTWAREMKLQIAMEHMNYDQALVLLKDVLNAGSKPKDLTSQAWLMAQRLGLVPALELALLLDRQDWIKTVLERAEESGPEIAEELPVLLELLPSEPRLLVLKALNEPNPRDGLDILLDLEGPGYIPADPDSYGEKKLALISAIGSSAAHWLTHIPVELIMEQALLWADSRAVGLVDWLEANCEDTHGEIEMLRQITTHRGTAPELIWTGSIRPVDLSISPNGKWLLCSNPEEGTAFINLDTGTEYPGQPWRGPWFWSPDSRKVAAFETGALVNSLYLYTLDADPDIPVTVELPPASGLAEPELLGWLDNATLLLSTPAGPDNEQRKAVAVDSKTGKIKWESKTRPGWPMLTTSRTLAWVWHEEGDLCIDLGNVTKRFNLNSRMPETYLGVTPLEWFPGDNRLLLQAPLTPVTAEWLDLDSGKFSYVELPFNYSPGNWIDDRNIWGIVSYWAFDSDYKALARFILETGERQYAGLLFTAESDFIYASQGNLVAIGTKQGTTVYKIP